MQVPYLFSTLNLLPKVSHTLSLCKTTIWCWYHKQPKRGSHVLILQLSEEMCQVANLEPHCSCATTTLKKATPLRHVNAGRASTFQPLPSSFKSCQKKKRGNKFFLSSDLRNSTTSNKWNNNSGVIIPLGAL